MKELASWLGTGTLTTMILSLLIEIAPIKVNPLQWLGKHFNAAVMERQKKIEQKLDDHIVTSYRNIILEFQEKLLFFPQYTFTQEQWNQVLKACKNYEKYIKENDIPNGEIEEATEFIKAEHKKVLSSRNFRNIPQNEKGGN